MSGVERLGSGHRVVGTGLHRHPESEITNLVSDLAGKAASVHTHAQADVTNLVSDLAGKAASVHTHAQADVTGLTTALAGKASSSHTHAQSDITNLTTDLAAKASTTSLTAHTGDTANPHATTKAQVGLGNADNTSDANKPVSTATSTALAAKADASATTTALNGKLSTAAWPGVTATHYYFPVSQGAAATSNVFVNATLRVIPWQISVATPINQIGGEVTVVGDAASTFRIGIYSDTGARYPGSLLVDAGTISGNSATVQVLTITQTLQPGIYWIGGAVQGVTTTQPTIRTTSGWWPDVPLSNGTALPAAGATTLGFSMTGVTGALPATFSTTVTPSQLAARLLVRAA